MKIARVALIKLGRVRKRTLPSFYTPHQFESHPQEHGDYWQEYDHIRMVQLINYLYLSSLP